MRNYSHEIAETVLRFFQEKDWHYDWDEENGVVHYGMKLDDCRFHSAQCHLFVNRDSFTTFLISPLSADSNNRDGMLAMAEFLSRANYELIHGCFEMDFWDGEIRYRTTIDCDGVEPSDEMIELAIVLPCNMMEDFADGIVEVLYGVRSPEEAWARCRTTRPAMNAMLRRLHSNPQEFLAGFQAFLASQMEETEGEEDDGDDEGFLAS